MAARNEVSRHFLLSIANPYNVSICNLLFYLQELNTTHLTKKNKNERFKKESHVRTRPKNLRQYSRGILQP